MKAEKTQKESPSRVIQSEARKGIAIVDNRPHIDKEAKMLSKCLQNKRNGHSYDNISSIQLTIDKDYKTRIDDLTSLNMALNHLDPAIKPILLEDFGIPGLTEKIVNNIIEKDNNTLYDSLEKEDVLDFYRTKLQKAMATPKGYESVPVPYSGNSFLYIKGLEKIEKRHYDIAIQHLFGGVIHRSGVMRGAANDSPYLHTSKSDSTSLYLISEDGEFRGFKKYTIIKQGRVSGGVHDFS